jgi:ABC-2 type transport system permease protein
VSTTISTPAARTYGAVNWVGLQTLLEREITRFTKVSAQTIAAPVISTLLFMMVFSLAMSGRSSGVPGVAYTDFLAPGLMMMGIISNAFQNSSSSMIIAKLQGNIVDYLSPPFSSAELAVAFIGGAVARGFLVGLASALAAIPFANVLPMHWWAVVFFAITSATIFGAMGLIAGMWANKFENLATIVNFIITPLTFLSGTFYAVDKLPEPFRTISHYNPVHLMIDGFRYGFTGAADLNLSLATALCGTVAVALTVICWRLLDIGWRIRS